MTKNTSLDILFRRIAFNDDKEAFKKVFSDFYPALCVFAQRYVSSSTICEDIVQDTFFHLWHNRKKIEVTSSFRNLLITSVRNRCTDYLRKQTLRQTHKVRKVLHENMDTPEEIYTIVELEKMLYETLDRLPPNVRKAFELSRFENLTYKKIAEKMDVSPKTVEAYISKALSILRVELKDYLPLALLLSGILIEKS